MIAPLRMATVVASAAAMALLLLPEAAYAQRRRAVPVVRSRPAVSIGVYYGPRVYRPPFAYAYPLYPPYWGPYYYSQWYPPYYYRGAYDVSGSIRIEARPREAQVFVDGYYAGVVDQFDGIFQRLNVEAGEHTIELYLPGHRIYRQEVYLQPGRTFHIRHILQPLGPGEPEPLPPASARVRPAGRTRDDGRTPPPIRPRDGRGRADRDRERDREIERDRADAGRSNFGALSVRVQPGDATITIDGEPWEGAEANESLIVQVGAGTHVLEIRKAGYRTYITEVTVEPGETTTLNVALTAN